MLYQDLFYKDCNQEIIENRAKMGDNSHPLCQMPRRWFPLGGLLMLKSGAEPASPSIDEKRNDFKKIHIAEAFVGNFQFRYDGQC